MTDFRSNPLSRRSVLAGGLALLGAGTLGGCGLGTAGGIIPGAKLAGPLKDLKPLDGSTIKVGSKNFSEQLIVGKMAVILFKAAGADAMDFTNIPGSASSRQALVTNQIQMVWEYTGTAWIAYMGNTDPIPDEKKQWQAVADEDLKKNNLVWLPPAPMNNTYGFAMSRSTADKLKVTKLSQLAALPKDDLSFCVESEFKSRNDGFKPMLKKYGISGVPDNQVKVFDTGVIYDVTAKNQCSFGEIFTTDGRILALDLTVLEDDRKFFPLYNLSAVIQKPTLEKNPQIRELFAPVSAKLTNDVLLKLNAQVDVDGQEPTMVAFNWLKSEGFITE